MVKTPVVHGIALRRPPISRMSCVCVAWMITPAPRKSSDLKNAWVTRWKSAATGCPAPSATNMNPSWLIVEYARIFLMSYCTTASIPPSSAVVRPMIITMRSCEAARFGEDRHRSDDEVDAGRDHRGRVDQRRGGRGAGHRVGKPDVQRHLGGLAHRAEEEQQRDRGRSHRIRGPLEGRDLVHVERVHGRPHDRRDRWRSRRHRRAWSGTP